MKINLSDYIGQTITVRFRNDSIVTAKILRNSNPLDNDTYPVLFNWSGEGKTYTNSGKYYKPGTLQSSIDIMQILSPLPMKKGLAQKLPNINFSRFLNKRVAVKFENGNVLIAKLTKFDSDSLYLEGQGWYNQSVVEAIYDEDAFNLELQEIPVDESVEKVVDLAKGMTTEQIAEVISRLKDSK